MSRPHPQVMSALLGNKDKTPCKWYALGKCVYAREGMKCGFVHDELIPPETIDCCLEKSKFGILCRNGARCLYKHEVDKTMGGSPEKGKDSGEKRRMA
jgi:hypothetical protein